MRRVFLKTSIMAATVFLNLSWLLSVPALAHFPWINLADYTPASGQAVRMSIGWGHNYPLGGFLPQKDLKDIFLMTPDGMRTPVTAISALEFETQVSLAPGAYVVAAQRKPGFYTKTTEGGKRQNKVGLNNVIHCSHSQMSMKAIVNVGDGKGKVDEVVGQPMEIIPLKNPVGLRTGEYLPVRVLLHGKPFKGRIFATYMGFSTEKDVFAYTTKTGRNGRAQIRILQPGVWMLKAEHQDPYPDQNTCDVESYVASLTFAVQ